MVMTTAATTNNVYYSVNAGTSWSSLTIPVATTESLVGCSVSYDGSMLEVISNTATYFINTNSVGNSIAMGSQAGQYNQAQNAIALGAKAATRNQAANSIALNASGQTLNAPTSGFYVAPIQPATGSASTTLTLLGYGSDQQVVQATGLSMNPTSGNVGITTNIGIGTTNPLYRVDIQQQLNTADSLYPAGSLNFSTTNGTSWWSLGRIQGYVTAGAGGTANGFPGGLAFYTKPATGLANDGTVAGMVLDSRGYLGIGKTAPTYPLDVNGSLNCTSLLVNGTAVATGTGSVWTVTGSNTYYTSGNVGIGTTNPATKFTVYSTAYNTHQLLITGQEFYANGWASTGISINAGVNRNNNKQLWIMDPDLALNTTNTAIRITPGPGIGYIGSVSTDGTTVTPLYFNGSPTIFPSGNVGIGKTNPSTKLWVVSDVTSSTFGGTAQWAGIHLQPSGTNDSITGITFGGNGGYEAQTQAGIISQASTGYGNKLFFQTTNDYSAGPKTRMMIDHAGFVGIGTTVPTFPLHLYNSSPGILFQASGYASNPFYLFIGTSNGALYLAPNVNTGTPGCNIPIGGNAWQVTSDIRLKKDVVTIESSLDQINRLRPVFFRYKNDKDTDESRAGFIAQEVQSVISSKWLVNENGMPEIQYDDAGNPYHALSMCDSQLTPYMVKSIQELSAKNKDLEAQVSRLADTVQTLTAQVSQLLSASR
jgi:hypothetical protein